MTFPTLNYEPHEGSPGAEWEPKITVAGFGDAYEQVVQKGLVSDDQFYNFAVANEDLTTIDALVTFFRERNGKPFLFTRPGDASAVAWRQNGKMRKTNEKANSADLAVPFKRWYGASE